MSTENELWIKITENGILPIEKAMDLLQNGYIPSEISEQFIQTLALTRLRKNGTLPLFDNKNLGTKEFCEQVLHELEQKNLFKKRMNWIWINPTETLKNFTSEEIAVHMKVELQREYLQRFLSMSEQEQMDTIKKNPLIFENIPLNKRTQNLCLAYLRASYSTEAILQHMMRINTLLTKDQLISVMKQIPEEARSEEVVSMLQEIAYMHLISSREIHFQDIPKEDLTEAICCFAIRKDSKNYNAIPEEMKTDMCKIAYIMHRYNNALAEPSFSVTEETETEILELLEGSITNEFLCLLLQQDDFAEEIDRDFVTNLVRLVPTNERTEELYILATECGYPLSEIPHHMLTKSVYHKAIKARTISIDSVPSEYQTEDIYIDWLKEDVYASLNKMPPNALSKGVYMQAFTRTFSFPSQERLASLQEVHPGYLDMDICIQACHNKVKDIVYVPQRIQDSADFWISLLNEPNIFNYLPYKYQSPACHYTALALNKNAFLYIPDQYKTAKMCRYVCVTKDWLDSEKPVIRDMRFLHHIPQRLLPETEDIFCIAARTEKDILIKIPSWAKTKNVCIEAVKTDRNAMKDVPDNLKDTVKIAIFEETERQRKKEQEPMSQKTLQEIVAELIKAKPDNQMYKSSRQDDSIVEKTNSIEF